VEAARQVSNQVVLFDRDRVKQLPSLADRPGRLSRARLLWVDVDRGSEEAVDRVAEEFELDGETREALLRSGDRALLHDHGRYLHVTAFAPTGEEGGELAALECLVGEQWVVTAHDNPIAVLEEFAETAAGSGDIGSMDGPSFLAALLEWVLGAYSDAFERIETRLGEFDVAAMRGEGDADKDIERLIELRLEVVSLRRALAAHRPALVTLTHPELKALGDGDSAERFRSLLGRFEATMQEARDAREAIVGSFDVLLARGGQRTNEIMKVLTLASVILLPGALLAGVMGMNFKVGLFDRPGLFWVVVAVIVAVAPLTLGVAKLRRWI
jgi:Mg2+ and Co2+ transporter CorA